MLRCIMAGQMGWGNGEVGLIFASARSLLRGRPAMRLHRGWGIVVGKNAPTRI